MTTPSLSAESPTAEGKDEVQTTRRNTFFFNEASMFDRVLGSVVLLTVLVVIGCEGNASKQQGKPAMPGATIDTTKQKTTPDTNEARAALKTALDSWAFGDSTEKFEKDHPGIKFF